MVPELVDRLRRHRTLAGVPRDQLTWVAVHGRLRHFAPGEVVSPQGQPIDNLWVVLSGNLSIRVNRGGGPRKVMAWRAGDVTGRLPYSRSQGPPGPVVAEETTEVVMVHHDDFPEMIRQCDELTSLLVHVMLDRAHHFTSSDLHDEKMLSLGKLAAGLAHELNNPASAVARSADALADAVAAVDASSRALGAAELSDTQRATIDRVRETYFSSVAQHRRLPLDQADREEEIAGWLERHGLDQTIAESLAESDVTLAGLDGLAHAVGRDTLHTALSWLAAGFVTRGLGSEIRAAASRIYNLVAAVKGFTYMDQTLLPTPVDVGRGLTDTLTVLQAKARAKSVTVSLTVEPELPQLVGFGGELNQIWANLIDNAIDAVPSKAHVEVTATRRGNAVVVRVVDDGPGIAEDIRERVFDPFFTTKPPGEGTGLGLDIVRRLVYRHDGEIDVDSRPGRTEFCVSLPIVTGTGTLVSGADRVQ